MFFKRKTEIEKVYDKYGPKKGREFMIWYSVVLYLSVTDPSAATRKKVLDVIKEGWGEDYLIELSRFLNVVKNNKKLHREICENDSILEDVDYVVMNSL